MQLRTVATSKESTSNDIAMFDDEDSHDDDND